MSPNKIFMFLINPPSGNVSTYVQKCMQWRNWRKIASLWRFELDSKSGPLEAGDFGKNGDFGKIGNFDKKRQKCMQWRKWQKNCQPLAI